MSGYKASGWWPSSRQSSIFRVDLLFQIEGDPDFPYVGKHIANLTLAQLKTLDCGSKRQMKYRELPNFSELARDLIFLDP